MRGGKVPIGKAVKYNYYINLLSLLEIGIPYDTIMEINREETEMILEIKSEMNKAQAEANAG